MAASPELFRIQPDDSIGGLLACLAILRGFPLPMMAVPLASNSPGATQPDTRITP